MAQLTAQRGMKPLFNGDRLLIGSEIRDPFCSKVGCGLRLINTHQNHFHKGKKRFHGFRSKTRIFSSLRNKSSSSNADGRSSSIGYDGGDVDFDPFEFKNDELACFRGLVLDISYRFPTYCKLSKEEESNKTSAGKIYFFGIFSCVTCLKCNSKKGHKTVEEANMKLLKVPKAPKEYDILAIPLTTASVKMLSLRKGTPSEWREYLSNTPLEQ
ncbi:hypothetical protein C5167_001989 [Papaver somniferum]|uniref:Uncharacterized protein n=1 Tax=Papaver somniferum TaxID=3469 RepID=A0A4Y7KWT5_PAPSO|nr:hypothetical protein C5167_001989 [Papaver somniferum]